MSFSAGKVDTPSRSFLSVAPFNNDIFSYSRRLDSRYVEVGSLNPVPGANNVRCPKGRILRQNGRKLFPGAYPGVNCYMVGVYDAISGIVGFIDPNSPLYTVYSTEKGYMLSDSTDPGPGGLLDKGMPILTNSSVDAGTYVSAGTNVTAGIDVSAGRDVRAGRNLNVVVDAGVGRNLSVGGKLLLNSGNTGVANMGNLSATVIGTSLKKLVVNAPECTTASRVFLTYQGLTNPGALSAENIGLVGLNNRGFQIVSSNYQDLGLVQWLVVN